MYKVDESENNPIIETVQEREKERDKKYFETLSVSKTSFLLILSLIFHATKTVTRSLLSHVKKHPNGENRSMFAIHLSDQRFESKHQLVHSTVLM